MITGRRKTVSAAVAAGAIAVAGAGAIITAPVAAAAPHIRPTPVEYGAPVISIPLNHDLTVSAHQSGIVSAAAAAHVTIPVPGWEHVIDYSADNLAWATDRAVEHSHGCVSYQFYLPPAGGWAAGATAYYTCPW